VHGTRQRGLRGAGATFFALLWGCSSSGPSTSPDGGGKPGHDASAPRDSGSPIESSVIDSSRPDHEASAPEAGDASKPGILVAYASGYSPDIDWFSVDSTTGGLASVGDVASFGTSPSFLAVNPAATHLYAVDENATGQVGAYSIDPKSGALTFQNAVSSGGNGPPFVSVDATGKFVLVANYGDGSVSVLPVLADGSLGAAVDTESVGAEAHMIVTDPTNHFVFVPCKGVDYVAQFVFNSMTGKLTPNAVPRVATATGAGPRHLAFHPNGRYAYLINETNSTLSLYGFDATAGTLHEIQTVSTIPSTFTGTNTAAEVHVHPSGAWTFGSNRGDDSLVVFAIDASTGKMTLVGFTPSGGTMPRDFTLDPTGTFLYAANQGTGNVVPFRFDATSGSLSPVATSLTVPAASFVGLVVLPGP
jgi:6-phosphogluconolactonase